MVRGFELGANVTENVIALRKALGSVAKPLSFADFASLLIAEGHPRKTLNASTVYDWTKGAEPDIASMDVMARIAGVSFEEFALGQGATMRTALKKPQSIPEDVANAMPAKGGAKVVATKPPVATNRRAGGKGA